MTADLDAKLDRQLTQLATSLVAPVLAGFVQRLAEDEDETDVDVGGVTKSFTTRAASVVFSRETKACTHVVHLHRASNGGVKVGTGVFVPRAYFFSDDVPSVPEDYSCVARDGVAGLRSTYRLGEDAIASELVPDLRDHVLPWFAGIDSEASLLAVLDGGGEFERVTASIVRILHRDRRGEADLRQIFACSKASRAWKERYRAIASRHAVRLENEE